MVKQELFLSIVEPTTVEGVISDVYCGPDSIPSAEYDPSILLYHLKSYNKLGLCKLKTSTTLGNTDKKGSIHENAIVFVCQQ
ncbi:hypothetical protein Y1Q_0019169 [Alligator mississippiensis]|uniref:Uncharacterized protein n=1 Tax=Alligator mississippiensis TaxID=8496 RepID=A0A151MQ78_ALLMI|nr:hypothetical protein Y1Q_0019169 [Alligator mississippiensis]